MKRDFKKQFLKDKNSYEDKHRRNSNQHELEKRMNELDEKYYKKHQGYEYGDLYDPNGYKSKNKDVREYSNLVDRYEKIDDEARIYAQKQLLKKYGSTSWKKAYKQTKKGKGVATRIIKESISNAVKEEQRRTEDPGIVGDERDSARKWLDEQVKKGKVIQN